MDTLSSTPACPSLKPPFSLPHIPVTDVRRPRSTSTALTRTRRDTFVPSRAVPTMLRNSISARGALGTGLALPTVSAGYRLLVLPRAGPPAGALPRGVLASAAHLLPVPLLCGTIPQPHWGLWSALDPPVFYHLSPPSRLSCPTCPSLSHFRDPFFLCSHGPDGAGPQTREAC